MEAFLYPQGSLLILGETGFAYSASSFLKFLENLCKWLSLAYLNLDKDTFSSPDTSMKYSPLRSRQWLFLFLGQCFGKCGFQRSGSWRDSTKLGSQELDFKGSIAPSTMSHHSWWEDNLKMTNSWTEGEAPLSWFSWTQKRAPQRGLQSHYQWRSTYLQSEALWHQHNRPMQRFSQWHWYQIDDAVKVKVFFESHGWRRL